MLQTYPFPSHRRGLASPVSRQLGIAPQTGVTAPTAAATTVGAH